ncbi:MAG TPA: response regulator transcription factor [Bacillota bacterium]|nr:response regulator transcription factor [Bacillota bacterium]
MKQRPSKQRSSSSTRKRVFLLDDHPITRYGLVQLINGEPDLTICGEAETAQQALVALKVPVPDLVLTDISLPGKSGLEFIKELQRLHPSIRVLVLSMHDETVYAERVLRAGARGYLMKSEGGQKLLEAIRQVLRGQVFLSPRMSTAIIDGVARHRAPAAETSLAALTDREFEIFQFIGQGFSTQKIGKCLDISIKTIGTHRVHIKQKLKLNSSMELVQHAVRWVATRQLSQA